MKVLRRQEEIAEAQIYFGHAAEAAQLSLCLRKKAGSIIVSEEEIIGRGYNAPPCNILLENCLKDNLPEDFKSDTTCCVHAEQRALSYALQQSPEKLRNSRLYFVNIDDTYNIVYAGDPYCTFCSKRALDEGVAEWVLWQEQGITIYDAKEYNELSFQFRR